MDIGRDREKILKMKHEKRRKGGVRDIAKNLIYIRHTQNFNMYNCILGENVTHKWD